MSGRTGFYRNFPLRLCTVRVRGGEDVYVGDSLMGLKNYGQCGDLYRSGRIKKDQYPFLVANKIRTVVNLQAEYDDQFVVQSFGLKYRYIPLRDKEQPSNEFAQLFLDTIRGGEGPYIVHCEGGKHRTGAAIAIYRIANWKWTFDQAWKEAKQFGYYRWFGHGVFEDYVREYYLERLRCL